MKELAGSAKQQRDWNSYEKESEKQQQHSDSKRTNGETVNRCRQRVGSFSTQAEKYAANEWIWCGVELGHADPKKSER